MLAPHVVHMHQCPKCGVIYDCADDEAGCSRFQKACDGCRFSLI